MNRRDAEAPIAERGSQREQLARLGLAPGASAAQVRKAHDAVVAYLAAAPGGARPWARRQMAEVDAAYASLIPNPAPGASAGVRDSYIASDAEDPDELLDALDGASASPRRAARAGRSAAPVPNRLADSAQLGTGGLRLPRPGGVRRLALSVGALAIALVGVVVIYKLGEPAVPGITGSPAPGASAAGVDMAQVGTLMATLANNPNDVATLRSLANVYYDGGDYATSKTWLDRILAIDPKDVQALLGAGANAYNLGDLAGAETSWRAVLAIDAKSVDAHYDLGLMYFSKNPPDMASVQSEWSQVLALAPDSQLADIVRTHLPDPSASPAASGGPAAPGGSPAAAPSAAPTASAAPAAS